LAFRQEDELNKFVDKIKELLPEKKEDEIIEKMEVESN